MNLTNSYRWLNLVSHPDLPTSECMYFNVSYKPMLAEHKKHLMCMTLKSIDHSIIHSVSQKEVCVLVISMSLLIIMETHWLKPSVLPFSSQHAAVVSLRKLDCDELCIALLRDLHHRLRQHRSSDLASSHKRLDSSPGEAA